MLFIAIMSTSNEAELALLVALDVLLEEQSVTRSARRLGVTQSAVSHKLRALRERFDDPLLVSLRGRLTLSDRARALKGPLRSALLALREAVRVGEAFDPKSSRRHFVIATNDYGEALFLPPLLELLRGTAPHVSVACEAPGRDVLERLEQARLDLAVIGPTGEVPPSIMRRSLHREGFVVLMRRGHALSVRPLDEAKYLAARHVLIAPGGGPGGVLDDWLAKRGKRRHVAARVSHFLSAPHVVASSDLLLTAPAALAKLACAQFPLVATPLPFRIQPVTAILAWHARSQADPGHRWLRTTLLSRTRAAPDHDDVAAAGGP